MGISSRLTALAGSVVALATIAGAGVWVSDEHSALRASDIEIVVQQDEKHVPHSEFDSHLSEQRVRTVFDYLNQIKEAGPQPWLCRGLQEELIKLCTELPTNPICADRESIIRGAGC